MPRIAVTANFVVGFGAGASFFLTASSAQAQSWVNFVNETSTRLIADPALVLNDLQEKDYAYGDFDHDGDEDLIIVRKTPFSVAGRHRNVLLMNEGVPQGHAINGVLVDRTTEFGTAATDGGQGLKDLTDDRDVVVVDVNGDGWLDFVTATTYGNGLPKTISHPRVYINLGEIAGVWQGFRYEENRFPNFGSHPNFCGVGAAALLDGLRRAVSGCQRGEFCALVTAPLQKSVMNDAGIAFSGHTEFLAELTGSKMPVMLLVAGHLRVALASTHLPLRQVADYLTAERLTAVIEVLVADLGRVFGFAKPSIVVCGLNPHAGEGGHLGHEDAAIIAPVVESFRAKGVDIRRPLPADTAFTPAAGPCDAVLAMYHDQGLPVLKYAGFGTAVNVTLGLPIIRTSVDHGTALDIAGRGIADTGSMVAATELALQLAAR
jgi:4-hydroxythreonine-4-phosphate dehydrogenase